MSKDYQLSWACPHYVIDETVTLGSDRQSLRTRQPVASENTVRIWAGYDFYIPQGGLYTPAQLFSSRSGPYDLVEDADTVSVTTSAGTAEISFGVSGSRRFHTDQVLREFQLQASGVVLAENINGHITLSDTTSLGTASYVKVGGSGASALGFGTVNDGRQWASRGRQLYPSWGLYTPPEERTVRFPRFSAPVKGNPVFHVSYAVPFNRCLRCGGSGQENDIRFDPQGHALMVENENLLYQASLKLLLTIRGSNPYHPEIGTILGSLAGSKAVGAISEEVSRDVHRALAQLQAKQQAQSKYQQVTFKERLYRVLSVRTTQSQEDPTTFVVEVVVQNASNEPVSLTVAYTTPDVMAMIKASNRL